MLLRLIRSNEFGLLNRTLAIDIKSCPTNLIPSRFEYFSRMGLSCKPFNDSTRKVYLAIIGSLGKAPIMSLRQYAAANWSIKFYGRLKNEL